MKHSKHLPTLLFLSMVCLFSCAVRKNTESAADAVTHEAGHVVESYPPRKDTSSLVMHGLVVSHQRNDTLLFVNIDGNGAHYDSLPETIYFERACSGTRVMYNGRQYKLALPISDRP